jgi:hypothetical protein
MLAGRPGFGWKDIVGRNPATLIVKMNFGTDAPCGPHTRI